MRRHGSELAALLVVTSWGVSFAFTFVRYAGMLALGWGMILLRRKTAGAVLTLAGLIAARQNSTV